jgi:hypothetical protein
MSDQNATPEPEATPEAQEDEVQAHSVLGLQELDAANAPSLSDPAMSCSSCVAATVCTSGPGAV